jgi:hypothetical protein
MFLGVSRAGWQILILAVAGMLIRGRSSQALAPIRVLFPQPIAVSHIESCTEHLEQFQGHIEPVEIPQQRQDLTMRHHL